MAGLFYIRPARRAQLARDAPCHRRITSGVAHPHTHGHALASCAVKRYDQRMAKLLAGILLSLLLFASAHAHDSISWTSLEEGLEMAELSPISPRPADFPPYASIRVLRIDPRHFTFRLFSARWEDGKPLPLRQWARDKNLTAAINACMFQKDGITATGYMREGEKYNNNRIAKRYGAFFAANPRASGLPQAVVLNRSHDNWQELLPQYETVVQNFRLTDKAGNPLWPEDGPVHAISAVAQTADGHILFMHCTEPVSIHGFARVLGHYPELRVKASLYAEGGKEASLLVRQDGRMRIWGGVSALRYLFSSGGQEEAIPNVLGAIRRQPSELLNP